MLRTNRKGYLVVSALLVVAVAMLYATATLASMKALRNESGWSQSRTQELAAARSATAKLVAEFNLLGDLEEGDYEGDIYGLPYVAKLRVDSSQSDIFHLTARVGDSEFTRVLRQEPRSLHAAFARTGLVTDPSLHYQSSLDGDWKDLPLPPLRPGDLNRIPATAANSRGHLFAFRFGRRLHPRIPTPFVSLYDVKTETWRDLPPIPYHFRRSLEERDGWTMETYSRQSVMTANDRSLLTIIGPNHMVNRHAPTEVAELFLFDLQQHAWHEVPRPAVEVYGSNGQLISSADEISIDQLSANKGQILVEMSGAEPVSTIFRLKDRRWNRLPPLPGGGGSFAKADSMACGPTGQISAVVRSRGRVALVRLIDGKWETGSMPTSHSGPHSIEIDSAGREWIQDVVSGKVYRSNKDGWDEKSLPDEFSREVDVGARPDDDLHYYQITTGY